MSLALKGRLTQPLVRTNGSHHPVSWDEALDLVAKSFQAQIEKHRGDAAKRLQVLRSKSDDWWRETATFFHASRSRTWIFVRRLNHSTHHRG